MSKLLSEGSLFFMGDSRRWLIMYLSSFYKKRDDKVVRYSITGVVFLSDCAILCLTCWILYRLLYSFIVVIDASRSSFVSRELSNPSILKIITDMLWLDNWHRKVTCIALEWSCLNFWLEENLWIIQCLGDSRAWLLGWAVLPARLTGNVLFKYFSPYVLFSSICSVICLDSISWCTITYLNCRLPQDWVKIKSSSVSIQSWKDALRKQWLRSLLIPLSYILFVSLPQTQYNSYVLIPSKFWFVIYILTGFCYSIWPHLPHLGLILYKMNIGSTWSSLVSTGIKIWHDYRRLLENIGRKLNILAWLNPS